MSTLQLSAACLESLDRLVADFEITHPLTQEPITTRDQLSSLESTIFVNNRDHFGNFLGLLHVDHEVFGALKEPVCQITAETVVPMAQFMGHKGPSPHKQPPVHTSYKK